MLLRLVQEKRSDARELVWKRGRLVVQAQRFTKRVEAAADVEQVVLGERGEERRKMRWVHQTDVV
jgi:hypothetical protein